MEAVAHQRKIRDREAARDASGRADDDTRDYIYVEPITLEQARAFILKYEWLGTVGHPRACYGLLDGFGTLIAVATFGIPAGQESRDICGRDNRDKAICLERGACAHFAHKHTASHFIPRVLEMASRDHGWTIFYAYADEAAGEIGTIYQACNWLYIGQGTGRPSHRGRWQYRRRDWPKGEWIDERSFYRRGHSIADVTGPGAQWTRRGAEPKHKYVQLVGDKRERKALRAALRYPPQSYPKRNIRKTKIHQVKDGRGRPATGIDPSVTIRLPADLLQWVDKKAKREPGGRTAIIRGLIADAAHSKSSI
ncbi:hypothetical protein [Bradyrhizobium genosp. P]|uniref:Mom family adenine methylcarbamoylation protein n=1 Tax=Bradyrhizobium genosp. P TaxID=83641 RepID=UPI003CF54B00